MLNKKKAIDEETRFIPERGPGKETAITEPRLPLSQSEKSLIDTSPQTEDLSPIDDIDTLIIQYAELKNSKKVLDEKLQQCKAKLNALFDDKATDSFPCRFGMLKRIHADKDTLWQIDL